MIDEEFERFKKAYIESAKKNFEARPKFYEKDGLKGKYRYTGKSTNDEQFKNLKRVMAEAKIRRNQKYLDDLRNDNQKFYNKYTRGYREPSGTNFVNDSEDTVFKFKFSWEPGTERPSTFNESEGHGLKDLYPITGLPGWSAPPGYNVYNSLGGKLVIHKNDEINTEVFEALNFEMV